MILHSILQDLQDKGFGTIGQDLQVGVLAVDANGNPRNGISLALRGAPINRIQTNIQSIDFYIRHSNSLTALQKAQELVDYLQESFSDVCDLPAMPPLTDTYSNVIITPTSGIEDVGRDDGGGYNYVLSGSVIYTKD